MKISIAVNLEIEVKNCNLLHLSKVFLSSLGSVFSQIVSEAVRHYGQEYKLSGELGAQLGHEGKISWKQLNGKLTTKLHTLFGKIEVLQLQVYLHQSDGSKQVKNVTRLLIGVSPYQRLPDYVKRMMGVLSSLCSYRAAQSCMTLLGWMKFGYGSFRRATAWVADRLSLGVCEKGTTEFVADGTGIGTLKTGKRGSELKVLAQYCKDGSLHLVNIGIGKYMSKAGWVALFEPLRETFKGAAAKELSVLMDGCKAILSGAKSVHERIKIQRDIWHICHQLKYYIWKDKVSKLHKIALIKNVFKAVSITWYRPKEECLELMGSAILFCDRQQYKHCRNYLMGCCEHLFTFEEQELVHENSSKMERMMRTVNQRMDIGVWTDQGALAVAKIRLAYFYNGFRPNMAA
ncbi:MAG: hypothetical protein AAF847_20275 [Bacteroidota bacterium]